MRTLIEKIIESHDLIDRRALQYSQKASISLTCEVCKRKLRLSLLFTQVSFFVNYTKISDAKDIREELHE